MYCIIHIPCPLDSILDAVFTVSPNKQYLGILSPTTPVTHGPREKKKKHNDVSFFDYLPTTIVTERSPKRIAR